MVLSSEFEEIKSNQAYLVDALRFALSISPYSIPDDMSLGLSLDRSSTITDSLNCRVKDILTEIDPLGRLEYIQGFVDNNIIRIIVRNRITDELFQYSLE